MNSDEKKTNPGLAKLVSQTLKCLADMNEKYFRDRLEMDESNEAKAKLDVRVYDINKNVS